MSESLLPPLDDNIQEALKHTGDIALLLTLTGRLACKEVHICVPGYEGALRITVEQGTDDDAVKAHVQAMFSGLVTELEVVGDVDPLVLVAERFPDEDLFTDKSLDDIIGALTNA